jgi:hypothetical protein
VVAKANSDKIVMVLSADWFAPFWKAFGLVTTQQEQAHVQRAARETVRDLMKGRDTYWNVDFDEGRIARTAKMFREGMRTMSEATVSQICNLLEDEDSASKPVATTLWLFGALCDQLAGTHSNTNNLRIDHATVETIRSLWRSSADAGNADEMEHASLRSATQWDQYLRSLTPDLPTSLADWSAIHLRQPDRFRRFWAHLFWLISAQDRQHLLEWLTAEAKMLADPTFELVVPDWMQ